MNKEIKEKWIDALVSGKYAQTIGGLCSEKGYCCLGVLADVVDPDGWKESPYSSGTKIWKGQRSAFKFEQLKEIGLREMDQEKLIEMNDDRDWAFPKIAGWIKENL